MIQRPFHLMRSVDSAFACIRQLTTKKALPPLSPPRCFATLNSFGAQRRDNTREEGSVLDADTGSIFVAD